jgi:hypothetical protein
MLSKTQVISTFQKYQKPLALVIFCLGILIGLVTRFVWLFSAYNAYLGEQARDGFVIMQAWQGKQIPFGPPSSIGGYYIPPLYFYFSWLFTALGTDPVFQALSNAVCSFFSIPLFGYVIYRSQNHLTQKTRLFLASLASFLWSIFATDIFFSGFEWNPNSITFWLMLFLVTLDFLFTSMDLRIWQKSLGWLFVGLIVGQLVSLHSSTLFMMPVILAAYSFFWGWKKKSYYSLLAWLSFVLSLWTYWVSEFSTKFNNTQIIINTLTKNSEQKYSWIEKLNHFFDPYFALGGTVYFPNSKGVGFFIVLLVLIFTFAVMKYKGKKFYLYFWLFVTSLFCLVSMNYWGILYMHYLVMLWSVPMFMLFSLATSVLETKKLKYFAWSLCSIFLILFFFFNAKSIRNIYNNKFSDTTRLPTVADLRFALSKIPVGAKLCSGAYSKNFHYLDVYENNQSRTIYQDCDGKENFAFMEKYSFNDFGLPKINQNLEMERPNFPKVFFENNQFVIFQRDNPIEKK